MEKAVNLLWTSGWDSTYRLLELLLVHKRPVQTYYLFDRNRHSYPMEVEAMEKIKTLARKKAPQVDQLWLPTLFKEVSEIKPNERITQQYQQILSIKRIGSQYEWLACFADEMGIDDLELCVDMRTPGFFTSYVKPRLVPIPEGSSYNYRLEDNPDNPVLKLFGYFRFPVQDYLKLDLQELAIKHGYIDIMEHTWFCHYPIRKQPCGICTPCKVTMEHGMRRRIPFFSQIRNFVHYRVKPPIRKLLKPNKPKAAPQAV